MRDLAETARVTLGSMSQTARRLEQLAYVTKDRGTKDRRKVFFTLTEQGRAKVADVEHLPSALEGHVLASGTLTGTRTS